MNHRVQVILDPTERELFRDQAKLEGLSLSAWFREAGQERLNKAQAAKRIQTPEDLDQFFAECGARETGREPDWEEHLAVMERSKLSGMTHT